MEELKNILSKINKSIKLKKRVDFEEFDLHFELEVIGSDQELKVVDSCIKLEGIEYFQAVKLGTLSYAIKKLNNVDLSVDVVEMADDSGGKTIKPVNEYLFEEMKTWPEVLRDLLFEAYANLYDEVTEKVSKSIKYEKFIKPTPPDAVKPKETELQKIEIPDEETEETEIEKLNKMVEKEVDQAQEILDKNEVLTENG